MSDSESSLSTPPATDDEVPVHVPPAKASNPAPQKKKPKKKKNGTILSFFEPPPSPPRKKRALSPPHEPVPEDNPDIAFIVMFRSRFADIFPPKCAHFGPQDIERGVAEQTPSSQIESLLCALLGLVLNRKKPVEKGHYGRALEEAVQTQKSQWPRAWNYVNPLHGGRTFNSMSPTERISLLKTLVLWSLNQSEAVNATIKEAYKSRSIKDKNDANIPLSVQPWGRDGDKRRYWLIEGQDNTAFRVYRESNPLLKNVTWWSVAGSIEELRELAKKLDEEDGTREAKTLSERMLNAIPRFEATEVKRKRREYKAARDARLARVPDFNLYEGRTRGKRLKYTFSDEEEIDSDALSVRRSTRNSARDTPAAPAGPTVTASGRQVRSRATGMYGESLLSGQTTERASPATGDYVRSEGSEEPQRPSHGRSTRASNKSADGWPQGRKHIETYNSLDEMDDEDDATSWDGGDEDDDEPDQMELDDDEDNDSGDAASDEDTQPKHLVVRLRYPKGSFNPPKAVPTVREEDLIKSGAPEQQQQQQQQQDQPSETLTGPMVTNMGKPAPATNGVEAHHATTADEPLPAGDPHTLPKLESMFSPTPPYSASEQARPQPQFAVAEAESNQPPGGFATTLPTPTTASGWQ